MSDFIIRPAQESDLPELHAMAKQFYAETTYQEFSDYCDKSVDFVARMMLDDGVFLVAEGQDKLVGMVGLLVAPFMFNHAYKTAHEVLWWVDSDARNSGAGLGLLQAIEPACRGRGVIAIQMGVLSTSPPQAGMLYERMGYSISETSFTRVLQ